MQVQNLQIVNFKGIEELNISPKGKNVYAVGGNGTGKTTFLDAVFKTLTGKNLPSKPTKAGARKGKVEIDLGDVSVEATFDAKREKMTVSVSSPEGGKYDAPRTMLDAIVGVIDFDVAGFLAATPRKQVDFLKGALGIDTTELDALYKKTFEERGESNKEVKFLEARNTPYDSTKTTLIEEAPLRERLQNVSTHNRAVANSKNAIHHNRTYIHNDELRIKQLEDQLAGLRANVKQYNASITEHETWLAANPEQSEEEISQELSKVITHNMAVEATAKELKHRAALKAEENRNERLTSDLKEIEERKAAKIAAVEMPVEGMSFTEDGLLLDGLPFESAQINTARQLIAGLQICSMLHKQVKIARFDGSLLDNTNLQHVEQWAAQHGIQLFIELVDRDLEAGGLRIVISE